MFPFSTCGQKEKALLQERIDSSFSILEFQKFSTLLRHPAPQCENACPYSSEITEELYQFIVMTEPKKNNKEEALKKKRDRFHQQEKTAAP